MQVGGGGAHNLPTFVAECCSYIHLPVQGSNIINDSISTLWRTNKNQKPIYVDWSVIPIAEIENKNKSEPKFCIMSR